MLMLFGRCFRACVSSPLTSDPIRPDVECAISRNEIPRRKECVRQTGMPNKRDFRRTPFKGTTGRDGRTCPPRPDLIKVKSRGEYVNLAIFLFGLC